MELYVTVSLLRTTSYMTRDSVMQPVKQVTADLQYQFPHRWKSISVYIVKMGLAINKR